MAENKCEACNGTGHFRGIFSSDPNWPPCPVCTRRNFTVRPIAELAEEGMRQGRAISASHRVWEYEGADGTWHQCRNADDACMWAEDGRRIREKTA